MHGNSVSIETDRASVQQVLSDWDQAFNDSDREQLLGLVTDDFELIPPDDNPVQGACARRLLEDFLQFDMCLDMSVLELTVSDEWAFSRFAYTMVFIPKCGGEANRLTGNGLRLLRKDSGGLWKIAKVSWTEEQ